MWCGELCCVMLMRVCLVCCWVGLLCFGCCCVWCVCLLIGGVCVGLKLCVVCVCVYCFVVLCAVGVCCCCVSFRSFPLIACSSPFSSFHFLSLVPVCVVVAFIVMLCEWCCFVLVCVIDLIVGVCCTCVVVVAL